MSNRIKTAKDFDELDAQERSDLFDKLSDWKIAKLLATANENSAIRTLADNAGWTGNVPPVPPELDDLIYDWDEDTLTFVNTAVSPAAPVAPAPVDISYDTVVYKNKLDSSESSTILFVDGVNNQEYEITEGVTKIDISIIAQDTSFGSAACFERRIFVMNDGSSVTQIGGLQSVGVDTGTNSGSVPSGWVIDVSINTDSLRISFDAGTSGSDINISAVVRIHKTLTQTAI